MKSIVVFAVGSILSFVFVANAHFVYPTPGFDRNFSILLGLVGIGITYIFTMYLLFKEEANETRPRMRS